jgi:hypothetical protein
MTPPGIPAEGNANVHALVAAGLTVFVRLVFVREAVRQRLFPVLRPLDKHHLGRRSGVVYATPIDALLTPEGAVTPLVYGPGVDWCGNVLAAEGCTLTEDCIGMHGGRLQIEVVVG